MLALFFPPNIAVLPLMCCIWVLLVKTKYKIFVRFAICFSLTCTLYKHTNTCTHIFLSFLLWGTAWNMQLVFLLSQCLSQIAIKSLSYCVSIALRVLIPHSYGAVMKTFVAPLFPYYIFSTTYFSVHSVWDTWCVFSSAVQFASWGPLKKSYLIFIVC